MKLIEKGGKKLMSLMGSEEIEQTTKCNKFCRPFKRIISSYPYYMSGISNDNLKLSKEALSTHAADENF